MDFDAVPRNIRIPFFAAEFSNVRAIGGLQNQRYKTLIVGQMLPTGNAEALKPYRISGKPDAAARFGAGSMLAEQVATYRGIDTVTEIIAVAVPDSAAAIAATATIAIAGLASSPGVVYCYINGVRFTAAVAAGAVPADVCGALKNAIDDMDLPVTTAIADDKLILTAKHAGEAGNDIDIRFNYNSGEAFPAGLTFTVTPFSGGGANPDVADALATVSGEWFNALLCPYLDLANLNAVRDEMERRFGPLVQMDGWLFAARRGTFGELCAFGEARNSKHECIAHCHGVPNSPWAFAAAVAANAMHYGNIDPARPFQTLPLTGILAPASEDVFSDFPENNQLLYNGISTFTVDVDGVARIGRLITTYKKAANGADDTSYLDLNTGMTLSYLRVSLRNHFQNKYPRCKLANDGILYNSGATIMTPKLAKAECIAVFREWEKRGLVEDASQFKEDLVVERDVSDPNRLNFLLSPNLVNQLIVSAARIEFIL